MPIRTEVAIEVIGLADDQRDGADEVEERPVIEWIGNGFLLLRILFVRLNEYGALGIDLELAGGVLAAFLELLNETEGRKRLGIYPALVYIVDPIQEISTLHPERRVPGGAPTQSLEGHDFHVGVADLEPPKAHFELHALS